MDLPEHDAPYSDYGHPTKKVRPGADFLQSPFRPTCARTCLFWVTAQRFRARVSAAAGVHAFKISDISRRTIDVRDTRRRLSL
jgi:hypothetical protein